MPLFEDEDLLYHYTKAPIAVESILRTGELRLSQLAFTNDPRESRTWFMSASIPDGYDLKTENFMAFSEEADGMLRRSVKLACFTQDGPPRDDRVEPAVEVLPTPAFGRTTGEATRALASVFDAIFSRT